MFVNESSRDTATVGLHVTVEAGLWFLIGAGIVIMRLASLDIAPLTNLEARSALDSLAILRGDAIMVPTIPLLGTVVDPLYSGLLSIVMSIFGTSVFFVRLISAVAGTWLCLLPILARAQMGRPRSLVFSFLLTLSPTLWFASRQANGHLLAWALAGTALLAFLQYKHHATAAVIGLLLACGQDAISPLLILVGSGLVVLMNREVRIKYAIKVTDLMIAIGTFVLASTLFLWRPSGLGDAFNGVATWPATLITPGTLGLARVVAGLMVYEPLLLFSTVISIAILVIQSKFNRIDAIWVVWIVAGLLLLIINQSRETVDMLPLMVGCAALATHVWIEAIQSTIDHMASWLAGAVIMG
ncbi:MAG: hypothetical protein NTV30_00105, partial [Chloroflexi bacterium]|nr:hypothetical protein [Chloroflexota bacterium]